MADVETIELLALVHFLRDLSNEELESLAGELTPRSYEAGDVIVEQGEELKALYFVLKGEVRVLEPAVGDRLERQFTLVSSDTLGETELVLDLPWLARLQAVKPTKLLRWSREAVIAFLAAHPQAFEHMRFAAESRVLAQRLRFDWLVEDEVIYGLVRKHPFKLVAGLALPGLVLFLAAGMGWWYLTGAGPMVGWAAIGVGIVGLLAALWQWIDWRNDFYLVTNRRVVWLEKVVALYDSRNEAPLHQVLSVSVSTDVLGRLLGYGDVLIRTFTGQVVFRDARSPQAMAAMIEEHWRRTQLRREAEDKETKAKAIRAILEEEKAGEQKNAGRRPPAPGAPPPKKETSVGLGHYTFEVRFEEEGVVTYRKHWAVLVRHIGFPTLAVLGVLALPILGLFGLVGPVPFSGTLLVSGMLLLPVALWWAYQYMDWANDLYQVTPTQIVDVYKRPLGREIRKVAPLENILGTEVDRRGLIRLVLNYGDVIANVGTQVMDFTGVFDPTSVQQEIVRAQEALLERKREQERRQRREEMVEWLNVYYNQIDGGREPRPESSSDSSLGS